MNVISFAFGIILLLTSCSLGGLNQVSVKKIKNEITGEIEKYGSIKISEDEQNDYFLDVKIPDGYEEAPTQFGDFLTVYRFSKGEGNQYSHEGIMISKTNLPEARDVDYYAAWIDQSYSASKGRPIFKNHSYGHEYAPNKHKTKTLTLEYIFPCSHMKAGALCFSGQKEVDIIKILKPNDTIWAIEYSNLLSPLGSDKYESIIKEKFEEGKKIIEDCCKILTVKKSKKN